MFEFKLPDLGEGIHEGEILHWHVSVGDVVKADDPLVEVETDKAAVTIPAPCGGKVVTVNGSVGEMIAVGSVVVVLDDGLAEQTVSPPETPAAAQATPAPAQATPAPAQATPAPAQATPAPAQATPTAPSPAPSPVNTASTPSGPVPAAPATRRLARELGVDLAQVASSGPAGRVTADDVRRHAGQGGGVAAPSPSAPRGATPVARQAAVTPGAQATIPFYELEPTPDFAQWGPVERQAIRSIRRKIAQKMVASMTIIPHVGHMDEADVTDLDAFRRQENQRRQQAGTGEKLTLLAFIIKAVVAQLRQRPIFNASVDVEQQEIVYKSYYNVGFAADTDKGLLVPVIHGADRLNINQLAGRIRDLAVRARDNAIELNELRGGTFTVTNVGTLGGTGVIPTINYPEVAILGLGQAADKPVVRDGEIVVRKMLPMTLAFDHRVIDGADAARFMTALAQSLTNPQRLLLEV